MASVIFNRRRNPLVYIAVSVFLIFCIGGIAYANEILFDFPGPREARAKVVQRDEKLFIEVSFKSYKELPDRVISKLTYLEARFLIFQSIVSFLKPADNTKAEISRLIMGNPRFVGDRTLYDIAISLSDISFHPVSGEKESRSQVMDVAGRAIPKADSQSIKSPEPVDAKYPLRIAPQESLKISDSLNARLPKLPGRLIEAPSEYHYKVEIGLKDIVRQATDSAASTSMFQSFLSKLDSEIEGVIQSFQVEINSDNRLTKIDRNLLLKFIEKQTAHAYSEIERLMAQ